MLVAENHTQTILKEHKASALLLRDNPIAFNDGRVIPHSEHQIQIEVLKSVSKKSSATSSSEKPKFLSLQKMQQIIELFITKKTNVY